MVPCYPGAAFINGQRTKIFTKLDIAIKLNEPGMAIMFTGKKGFIPARIAQVPIPPPKPTAIELEILAKQQEAKETKKRAKEAAAKKAAEAAATATPGAAAGLAGAAEAATNGEEEMETEPARPPTTTKYVWSAVAADGTTKKLDPKTDLIPVSAADGDYELGLANFCPYHAVNGLLLHKGTTHT